MTSPLREEAQVSGHLDGVSKLFQGVEGSNVNMQCLSARGHQCGVQAVPVVWWAAEATLGWVRGGGDSEYRGFLFETSNITSRESLLEMKNFASTPRPTELESVF